MCYMSLEQNREEWDLCEAVDCLVLNECRNGEGLMGTVSNDENGYPLGIIDTPGEEGNTGNLHHVCSVDGGWSDYGEWTVCTQTCGGGEKTRYRTCTNPAPIGPYGTCQGFESEITSCNEVPCVDCLYVDGD
eukprot:UN30087